jgi:transcription elongation factor GreA
VTTQPTFLTREGYQRLEQELHYLSTVRRSQVVQHLSQVLPEGDNLENGGVMEIARNEQAFVEGRIQTLKDILSKANIIEGTRLGDTVELGSYVTVVDLAEGDGPETYRIVGSSEADPVDASISNESPLGQALIGHGAGEIVTVNAPGGKVEFKILEIH